MSTMEHSYKQFAKIYDELIHEDIDYKKIGDFVESICREYNIKNDYSIWGTRKGINGAEIPIHARYAIHKKPKYYKAYDGSFYCSDINMFDTIK